ncbi:MAG: hypothetical protein LBD96_10360, partial [Treponema sp.]|nr:hypothetical protein [Treponema sp.]
MTAGEALEAARGLDFEKVWAMFQETDKQIKEFSKKADLRQEELVLRQEEVARQQEETGRQIKEFSKKADLRQEELVLRHEEVARQQEETGKQIKELSRETGKQIKELSRETDRQIKELSRNIGGLSSSLGRWAEEMISANLWEKFKALGFTFTHGGPEKYWENNRIVAQVDILLENGDYAMPVEVKSVLTEKDVDEHL